MITVLLVDGPLAGMSVHLDVDVLAPSVNAFLVRDFLADHRKLYYEINSREGDQITAVHMTDYDEANLIPVTPKIPFTKGGAGKLSFDQLADRGERARGGVNWIELMKTLEVDPK